MLIVQMDWFALNLAIPAIAKHFNVASTDLQWVVSGYMLSIGALMVTAGRLADIFGRRPIIVIGLAIFGIVSLVCGTAPDELYLIIACVIHGVGAALIFPVSIAVVSSTFTGARQARDRRRAGRIGDRAGTVALRRRHVFGILELEGRVSSSTFPSAW